MAEDQSDSTTAHASRALGNGRPRDRTVCPVYVALVSSRPGYGFTQRKLGCRTVSGACGGTASTEGGRVAGALDRTHGGALTPAAVLSEMPAPAMTDVSVRLDGPPVPPQGRDRLDGVYSSVHHGAVTDSQNDLLFQRVKRSLETDRQWIRHFDPSDTDGIAAARSAGRRVGRALGVKVVTHQSDPQAREDGQVVVAVVIDEELDPAQRERMSERARQVIDDAFREGRGDQ